MYSHIHLQPTRDDKNPISVHFTLKRIQRRLTNNLVVECAFTY